MSSQEMQTQTPAAKLLWEQLSQGDKSQKKGFLESLKNKRLICLDRAAVYEELILELGGKLEEYSEEDNISEENRSRGNKNQDEEEISEGRPKNVDGSPDLRKKENFDIRSEQGEDITKDGKKDHRFKGNETEKINESRHNSNDGRGQVKDPENDLRLKENLSKRQTANT